MMACSKTMIKPKISIPCLFLIILCYVLYHLKKQYVWPSFIRSTDSNKHDICGVHRGEYSTEVDFRIIVLTLNRSRSLELCLQHIADLDTCGDKVAVDIWIDRSQNGSFDFATLQIARNFAKTWSKGDAFVHVQAKHVGIMGQWIDTWRPEANTSELALFIEDDIDISKHAYRWIRSVHRQHKEMEDIAGYTLQMENVNIWELKPRRLTGPPSESVFIYKKFASWGFAPKPKPWREFQDWFYDTRSTNPAYRPYMEGMIQNNWYKSAEKNGTQDNYWSIWFTHFCAFKRYYTFYSNLLNYTGRNDVMLEVNRREDGLHYRGRRRNDTDDHLLQEWNWTFEKFPSKLTRYDLSGKVE